MTQGFKGACGATMAASIAFMSLLTLGPLGSSVVSAQGARAGRGSGAAAPAGQGAAPRGQGAGRGRANAAMSKADVQRMWAAGARGQAALVQNVKTRGLAFEPEEDWLKGLPDATKVPPSAMPEAMAALTALIPAAPTVDAVTTAAPDLLARVKAAAQKRSDTELEQLVHPDLMASRAKVYDLFDTTNYQNHMLGRFVPVENRRIGVQFFQLTNQEVERLHYVQFGTSRGKIVLRDVVTGSAVADQYLKDEQQLALSKLDQVYRALRDGDKNALRSLSMPGLYDEIDALGGVLTGGLPAFSAMKMTSSVPVDSKSIRVVTRMDYTLQNGTRMVYDVDFERIDNDIKVVRLRDVKNGVIAIDPNIDNYLRRRFGLPEKAPLVEGVDFARTAEIIFTSKDLLLRRARIAVEDRNSASVQRIADLLVAIAPQDGAGYGVRASALYLSGRYDEAQTEAVTALARGGTIFLTVLRHQNFNSQMRELFPVILAVSRERVDYLPMTNLGTAGAPESFPARGIVDAKLEGGGLLKGKPRPFVMLEFKPDPSKRDSEKYNFAAFGTTCPEDMPTTAAGQKSELAEYPGGTICAAVAGATTRTNVLGIGASGLPLRVPREWQRDLGVVMRTLLAAKELANAQAKK